MAREAIDGFPALEAPRQAEARQRDRQPRFLQLRGRPAPSAVGRDLDALDPSVVPTTRGRSIRTDPSPGSVCPPDGNVMTDFASI